MVGFTHPTPREPQFTKPLALPRNENYSSQMFEVHQTDFFERWVDQLRDRRAAERISARLTRLRNGLMGDVKYFDSLGELRIDYGPGYRVYFVQRGQTIIVLLCGGDKSTQSRDIIRAKTMAQEV